MIQPLVVHISRLLGLSSVPSRFSREQQRQASQHLLQLLFPHSTLAHSAEGAPLLQGSSIQLSLSHSGDYLALLTAPPQWRVGIDLETDFSRPLRLAARFLSQEELSLLSTLPPREQSRYALASWCAREAVYKAIPNASVDFRRHYTLSHYPYRPVISYHPSGEDSLQIPLHFYRHQEYLLAYCALFRGEF